MSISLLYDPASKHFSIKGLKHAVNLPDKSLKVVKSSDTLEYPVSCILGILNDSNDGQFLFFCTESESVGFFKDKSVYKCKSVDFILLSNTGCYEEASMVLKLLSSLEFYYTFDPIESHFIWNVNMQENLSNWLEKVQNMHAESSIELASKVAFRSPFSSKIKQSDDSKHKITTGSLFVPNLFCGYCEAQNVNQDDRLFNLKIISKISIKKIGTRILSRGVADNGVVSFFVETKFLTESKDGEDEFTILRGSVPLFWSQNDPLKPHKIDLEEDEEKNGLAFKKHFDKLKKGYGRVVVVDLLGSKKYEKILSKTYKRFCDANQVGYIKFDLNNHTQDLEVLEPPFYSRLDEFIIESAKAPEQDTLNAEFSKKLSFISKEDSFDIEKTSSNDDPDGWVEENQCNSPVQYSAEDLISEYQKSGITFRVNCMDCLDRTNLAQYMIFKHFYKHSFDILNKMWVNNGNALSNMYTGSDALKSDIPTKGRISVLGKVNDLMISANRMIQNKFIDKDKQYAIDLVLGKKSS